MTGVPMLLELLWLQMGAPVLLEYPPLFIKGLWNQLKGDKIIN